MWWVALALLACKGDDQKKPSGPDTVDWFLGHASTVGDLGERRGLQPRRSIVHLHSPYSHDACDGEGYNEARGTIDERCLKDFRFGLCANAIDVAYVTDHPDYSDSVPFEERLLLREDDDDVRGIANRIHCDDGHEVVLMPGHEDALMPVGLERAVADDQVTEHDLLNRSDADALKAMRKAGALVFQAHPEERSRSEMETRQDDGLTGHEIFNLHAMFAPDTREDIFGLDAVGWISDISSFTNDFGTAEPDLFFLAVFQEQAPNIAHFDALAQRGPVVGIAGTDAHQNVLNLELRDGDRGDSYRRMTGWFANILLTTGTDPNDFDAALSKGRSYVAFEALGVADFDMYLTAADGKTWEMGSDAPAGTLTVACPTLARSSPRDGEDPDITVTIYKDGKVWQRDCGDFEVDRGVYRVRADIVPHHLRAFLGEDPDPWMKPYPWVYSNPIRVNIP